MKKTLFFGVISLIYAFTCAPIGATSLTLFADGSHPEPSPDQHSEQMPGHHGGQGTPEHEHHMMAVPDGQPMPSVKLIVHPDPMQGWNLELQVENFQFAPEHIDQPSIPTEGHAHLYVNGNKIARLYGNWYHLSELPSGLNEITVSLNTNGHETLTWNGQTIQDTVTIEVQP